VAALEVADLVEVVSGVAAGFVASVRSRVDGEEEKPGLEDYICGT
jgi:hypothetical protein